MKGEEGCRAREKEEVAAWRGWKGVAKRSEFGQRRVGSKRRRGDFIYKETRGVRYRENKRLKKYFNREEEEHKGT